MKRLIIHDVEKVKAFIKAEIQRTDEARFQHRLHCILLICDGKTCAEVAALFSDGLRTVQYFGSSGKCRGTHRC